MGSTMCVCACIHSLPTLHQTHGSMVLVFMPRLPWVAPMSAGVPVLFGFFVHPSFITHSHKLKFVKPLLGFTSTGFTNSQNSDF
jgi:hypothetical protein